MARRPTITTTIVNEIRALVELGVPKKRVARQLGVAYETVVRYATPEGEARVKEQQRRRYLKEKDLKPEVIERRRAAAREYYLNVRRPREEAERKRKPKHEATRAAGVERRTGDEYVREEA